MFTKYGRRGTPHKVYVKLTENNKQIIWWDAKKQKEKDARSINVADVTLVIRGADNTSVMRK